MKNINICDLILNKNDNGSWRCAICEYTRPRGFWWGSHLVKIHNIDISRVWKRDILRVKQRNLK